MSYYPQTIASKMKKGLTNEIAMICEIGKVLREDGNSNTQVSYFLNVDEDFIPDVLGCYPKPEKKEPRSSRASSHWPHCS
jgi:hypothetical protein